MEKQGVIVVDMINGFIKEGALHDESILSIVPNIQKIVNTKVDCLFVADSHCEHAGEFNSFPIHCLQNSTESQVIDELKPYVKEKLILKNSTNTMWSIDYDKLLSRFDCIVLVGCCTDICILHFALSLQTYINEKNWNKSVVVVEDAVDTYHIETLHDKHEYHDMAIKLMKVAGVKIKTTKEITD